MTRERATLKHLLTTSPATRRAIERYLRRTPRPLRAERKNDR